MFIYTVYKFIQYVHIYISEYLISGSGGRPAEQPPLDPQWKSSESSQATPFK